MKAAWWVLAVVLGGCAQTVEGPLKAASSDMSCPEDELNIRELSEHELTLMRMVSGPTTVVAMGCGRARAYARMCIVPDTAGADPTCSWYPVHELKERELRKRAAFDANCAPDQLALQEIDDGTMGVQGCGQRLSYAWSCPHSARLFSSACHWVLDAASRRAQPAEAAPAATPTPAAPPAAPSPRPTEI